MRNVLIIIEVLENDKIDLRYVTVSSTENKQDAEFVDHAIKYLKSSNRFEPNATFTFKQLINFGDYPSYKTFFDNQVSQYINMTDDLEAAQSKNSLEHLHKVVNYEGRAFEVLPESAERDSLLNIIFKLLECQDEIAAQPEGLIELKENGNLYITGFSTSLKDEISTRIRS